MYALSSGAWEEGEGEGLLLLRCRGKRL